VRGPSQHGSRCTDQAAERRLVLFSASVLLGAQPLKTYLLILCASLIAFSAHASDTIKKALPAPTETTALVYYFGFDIDTIAGLHKEQVEEYGCIYTVAKSEFLKALTPASKTDAPYNKLVVKAEVKFSPDTSYLIDIDGHVSLNDQQYVIDKRTFARMLHQVFKGCRK